MKDVVLWTGAGQIGLAIARRIARNHNGDIKAFSENGETVFSIILK